MTTFTVGSGERYTTISAAVAAAKPGDTIDIKAGTYTDDFPATINGLTLEGVGGTVYLKTDGAQPSNGKAYLDIAGNVTIKNLDISGVTVPDANGAAIRYESGNLTLQNVTIHGNQDGILGAADPTGNITIDSSEFYDNGTSTGSTHNIYIGAIASFTLTNSYIHDANTGHEVKSRAANNVITNNRILDNSGTASYEIDLPNGGNATITNNTIQKSASSGNHVSIAYGEEYVPGSSVPEQQLNPGTSVVIANNTLISDQSGADVLWDKADTTLAASGSSTRISFQDSGNTIYGYAAIDKDGHVTNSGFTAVSSRPSTSATTGSGNSTPTPADTTPPTLSITESVSGTTTSRSQTLSGTVSDGGTGVANVEVYDLTGGATVDLGAATTSGTSWSFTANNLALGTHKYSAVATDKAGNSTNAIFAEPSETIVAAAITPAPAAPAITAVTLFGGYRLFDGTATAGSIVTLSDTTSGSTHTIGATVAGRTGDWSYGGWSLSPDTVHTVTASAANGGGTTASVGSVILASSGNDTLTGTAGKADFFAFARVTGRDVIQGFETARDVIDLSGTVFHSFTQLKPTITGASSAVIRLDAQNSITLTGVSANSLSTNNFRFT